MPGCNTRRRCTRHAVPELLERQRINWRAIEKPRGVERLVSAGSVGGQACRAVLGSPSQRMSTPAPLATASHAQPMRAHALGS